MKSSVAKLPTDCALPGTNSGFGIKTKSIKGMQVPGPYQIPAVIDAFKPVRFSSNTPGFFFYKIEAGQGMNLPRAAGGAPGRWLEFPNQKGPIRFGKFSQ